jgi:hypothetical protein
VNRYISVEQLTTDTKLAGVLTVGGTIRYKLKDDNHASLQFLKITVAPKMHHHFGADPRNSIADMLALPLLWACREPSLAHMINPQELSRVQQGYTIIRGQHGITYNPVYKPPPTYIACGEPCLHPRCGPNGRRRRRRRGNLASIGKSSHPVHPDPNPPLVNQPAGKMTCQEPSANTTTHE